MKPKYSDKTKNKSTGKNDHATLASSEWYQQPVRFVELRDIFPRTRETYLAWVRRLHEARAGGDITALSEGELLDFLVAPRHERELRDSTINQAACTLRGFHRDHLGRDRQAWSKIKITLILNPELNPQDRPVLRTSVPGGPSNNGSM